MQLQSYLDSDDLLLGEEKREEVMTRLQKLKGGLAFL